MTTKKGIGSYPADDVEPETGDAGNPAQDPSTAGNKAGHADDPADIQNKLDKYRDEMVEDAPSSDDKADRN